MASSSLDYEILRACLYADRSSKKKGKYWLGKPFLWFLSIWYTVGVSLIPSAAIIHGLPRESVWWAIMAFYGLAGWFVSGLRISTPLMHLFGGVVYAFLL